MTRKSTIAFAALCAAAMVSGAECPIATRLEVFKPSWVIVVEGRKMEIVPAEMKSHTRTLADVGRVVDVWTGHTRAGDGFKVVTEWTEGDEGRLEGTIRFEGYAGAEPVSEIQFPAVKVPFEPDAQFLWGGSDMGFTFSADKLTPGKYDHTRGMNAMQFGAILRPSAESFYFDYRDPVWNIKSVRTRLSADRIMTVCGVYPVPRMDERPVAAGCIPYPAGVKFYRGGWYDAARIYRPWALKQSWAKNRPAKNPLADIDLWIWNRGLAADVIPPIECLADDLPGVKLALDWYWWHSNPYDTDYPFFWPPREGVEAFTKSVKRLNDRGIYSQVYVNGMCWDIDSSHWTADKAVGLMHRRSGDVRAYAFNKYNNHRLAWMCGEAPAHHDAMSGLLANLRRTGLTGQYLDMIGNASFDVCWNPAHKHVRNGGHAVTDGYREMLARLARENPGYPLTTEGSTELYMDRCDGSIICNVSSGERMGVDSREIVPLFTAVYHGSYALFGNYALPDAIPPWDPKWPDEDRWPAADEKAWHELYPDQFYLEMARPLIWGAQPMVCSLRPKHRDDPAFKSIYRFILDTANFYHANKDFLWAGEMMSPDGFVCAEKEVDFFARMIFTKKDRARVIRKRQPCVLHSCWKNARGEEALFICNYTTEPQAWSFRGQKGTLRPHSYEKRVLRSAGGATTDERGCMSAFGKGTGVAETLWNSPGVRVEGTCSFVSGRESYALVPCPERHPAARRAFVDAQGGVRGYLTARREADSITLYAHQVGSGGENPSLCGEFTLDLTVTTPVDAIPCRTKEPKGNRVVSFGTPFADSRLNDALFLREKDTLVRFESSGTVNVATEAPGRFRVRLAGSNDTEVAIHVTADYFRNRNMPHYKAINRKRAPHAPTGWMAWNIYFDQATAEDNLREARAAAKLLKPYGLEIWSIESWQGNSDKLPVAQFHNLDLSCNERQFPQGMKAVADEIRALGFKPGLWIVPWGTGDKAFYEAHKSWFAHRPDGRPVGLWPGRYILDFTNDEAVEYVRGMIRTYVKDWGYEFFKIDGMGAGLGWPSLGLMRPEIRRSLARPDLVDPVYRFTHMFREAMGEDAYFLACGAAPTSPGIEDCDATRIGGDIVSPNRPVDWAHARHQAAMTLRRNYHNNIVAWNDPDTLMVDPKALTIEEARVTTTVVGLPGGVMFAGDKIAALPPERLALVRQDLPVAETRPMDLYPIPELKDIWNLAVKTPYQAWNTVALFNWDDTEKDVGFGFAEIGLDPAKEYAVYETWTEAWQGFRKDHFSMRVPAHGVRLVTVHPRSDRPILLSSDRHITRGFEDVLDCRAEDGKVRLRVKCVAGHVTTVRLLSPDGTVTPVRIESPETGVVEKTVDLVAALAAFSTGAAADRVDFDIRDFGAAESASPKNNAARIREHGRLSVHARAFSDRAMTDSSGS